MLHTVTSSPTGVSEIECHAHAAQPWSFHCLSPTFNLIVERGPWYYNAVFQL